MSKQYYETRDLISEKNLLHLKCPRQFHFHASEELHKYTRQKQESKILMKKEMGLINWNKTSKEIHNLVRGTNPWPGAFTFYNGNKVKIWKTKVVDSKYSIEKSGTICSATKNGIDVVCGKGIIKILEIQFDCCRRLCISDFICGHKLNVGELFG